MSVSGAGERLSVCGQSVTVACPAEAQRDIHQHTTEDLSDAGLEGIHLSFYLTSIYDHSIFEVRGM